jgi:hypothetical protein
MHGRIERTHQTIFDDSCNGNRPTMPSVEMSFKGHRVRAGRQF